MIGVLLQRAPAKVELINDLNERVINWWRVVRDRAEEFERLIACTPHSRSEFEWAWENLDNEDPLYRALAFHVVCSQSARHTDLSGRWILKRNPGAGSIGLWHKKKVVSLAHRLRHVQLEMCDAVALLEKLAGMTDATIYCDPPYEDADDSPYAHTVDRGALHDVLLRQRGQVAVSGYGDEWDSLGWRRAELDTFTLYPGGSGSARTEVLWMNYEPESQLKMNL